MIFWCVQESALVLIQENLRRADEALHQKMSLVQALMDDIREANLVGLQLMPAEEFTRHSALLAARKSARKLLETSTGGENLDRHSIVVGKQLDSAGEQSSSGTSSGASCSGPSEGPASLDVMEFSNMNLGPGSSPFTYQRPGSTRKLSGFPRDLGGSVATSKHPQGIWV